MPWYKAGTVSVTLNSNAVIGTGTAFLANSRVGDAFRGPDGAWYEVINVASDTAMAIAPNYQGATNAAGIYALAPMQGYVKDSADALRAVVNTYGSKLAALGTTGNYDILPLNKGGTGAADAAGARTGLGLGTVSIENIVPVAKGGTGGNSQSTARTGLGLGSAAIRNVGTAAGELMEKGAFGLGAVAASPTTFSPVVGFSNHTGTSGETPAPGSGGTRITQNIGGSFYNEITITASSVNAPVLAYRQFSSSGTPGLWNTVYTNQNTTRAADGTLKAI